MTHGQELPERLRDDGAHLECLQTVFSEQKAERQCKIFVLVQREINRAERKEVGASESQECVS